jgi:predicted N-acetyltransferase YhbS
LSDQAREAGDRSWIVEPYRPGDEHELLSLFNRVFGLNRSLQHWEWQFKRNPYGGPFISLARHRENRMLVGSHVVMPFPLNVKGNMVLGGHTLDLVVHPDYRRQGIFEGTARHCFATCVGAGAKAVVAFPNASSYPGFVRSLGWHRILFPEKFTDRLRIDRELIRMLRWKWLAAPLAEGFRLYARLRSTSRHMSSRRPRGVELGSSPTVPDAHDRLWEVVRSQEVLSIWKDAAYFRWRYDSNPDHDFTYFWLADRERIQTLVVTVERDGVVTICELLVANRDVGLAQLLVSEVVRESNRRGMHAVSFLGYDVGMYRDVFSWFSQRVAYENVFCGQSLGDSELGQIMAIPQNWTITYGDGDFV